VIRTALLTAAALTIPLAGTTAGAAVAAGTATTPSARAIVRAMADEGARLTQRRAEGPDAEVTDGICSHVAEAGCRRAMLTKDASLLVFGTAAQARDYRGGADDRAVALGRMVVSFGAPARVPAARQPAYVEAVRDYRSTHPHRRNDVTWVWRAVMGTGLPMRDGHLDEGEQRAGLAARLPGAVDMVVTRQVDVLVFGTVHAAEDYAGASDDQTFRRGRVVLSFGNPPLLGPKRQASYADALRAALG
jgi:hypothetical protein